MSCRTARSIFAREAGRKCQLCRRAQMERSCGPAASDTLAPRRRVRRQATRRRPRSDAEIACGGEASSCPPDVVALSALGRSTKLRDRSLFRLDICELHDLAPLLGFGRDQLAEVAW